MKATFVKSGSSEAAYIQRTYRKNGRPTSENVLKLGTLEDIRKREGCDDPKAWVRRLAEEMTLKEKAKKEVVSIDFSTHKEVKMGQLPLRRAGDMFMFPIYNKLGLAEVCADILKGRRIKYDINEILRTLVFSRILFPCSKEKTFLTAQEMIIPPTFKPHDMYRALSELCPRMDDLQAAMYKNSKKFLTRSERVIYYDCSNYYFEIEDNDKDTIDKETGEFIPGLRKRGKSKENRPNPIVQVGMFMDGDGIPLAFCIFPGNESEQIWLQPLEETLGRKFELTEFVISTDSGLASESNRRYNMAEGRDYICVQSLAQLNEDDQKMAISKEGWRIAYCSNHEKAASLPTDDPERQIFNLESLLEKAKDTPDLLRDITFYKEMLATKKYKYTNPEWLEKEGKNKGARHKDANGKIIPQTKVVTRQERIIVTYSHNYDLYLKHKRQERLKAADGIIKNKDDKGRHSQQSPRKYIKTIYRSIDGKLATNVEMAIDGEVVDKEERFDGFYAYGTSLEDDAMDILKARSFHHEIEHLFRTSKTFLDARPVHLTREDRIKSHFLICFIAMTVIKILQKQLTDSFEQYKTQPLSIDSLIETLRKFRFRDQMGRGYSPDYERTPLTDNLQDLVGVKVNTQIITPRDMKSAYQTVNKC